MNPAAGQTSACVRTEVYAACKAELWVRAAAAALTSGWVCNQSGRGLCAYSLVRQVIPMQTSRCVFSVPRTCQWVGIGACTAVVRVCVLAWRRVVVRAAARCYGLVLRVRVKGQSKGRGKGQRKGFRPSA